MTQLVTYIAVKTKSKLAFLNDKHVTLAYAPIQATAKLPVEHLSDLGAGVVKKVEYWAHVDLTVAVLISSPMKETQEALAHGGFEYDHKFIPHITIGKGNTVHEHQVAQGYTISFHSPYVQIRESK